MPSKHKRSIRWPSIKLDDQCPYSFECLCNLEWLKITNSYYEKKNGSLKIQVGFTLRSSTRLKSAAIEMFIDTIMHRDQFGGLGELLFNLSGSSRPIELEVFFMQRG